MEGKDDEFEQQSFMPDEGKEEEKESEPLKRPLRRDDSELDEKETKDRYFEKGACVKLRRNETTLLFLGDDIVATHEVGSERDSEGFERFFFKTNANLQGSKDYVRAVRGKFSVVFNLDPGRNVLWIRAKDGSIREAKKYLKNNRILD